MPADYRAPYLHSERGNICLMYGYMVGRWPLWRRRWHWWIVPRTYPAYYAVKIADGWTWTKLGAIAAGMRARTTELARRRITREEGDSDD